MIPHPANRLDVTLCIAALAYRRDAGPVGLRPCAVLSYDRRIEGAGASETAFKMRRLSSLWRGMYAGTVPYATELISRLRVHFQAHESSITEDNALDHLYEPIHRQIGTLAERRAANCAGVANGAEMKPIRIDEELLLVGWVDDRFRIYRYYYPEWHECDPFAAIGAGIWVAEAMLQARESSSLRSAAEVIYRLYEAQRMGNIVPSVGSRTALAMLTFENGIVRSRDIRSDYALKNLWERFGFRDLDANFSESDFDWGEPY